MNRIIISGFACPPSHWAPYGSVISLADLMDEVPGADFKSMAERAASKVKASSVRHIVLHDFGVAIGFLAIRNLLKDGYPIEKITFFNGAVRGFDVFENRHPFWILISNFEKVKLAVEKAGGEMDPRFMKHITKVKKLYLQVILFSIHQKLFKPVPATQRLLKTNAFIEMIFSKNDSFISVSALEQLVSDLKPDRLEWTEYGHFPYSLGYERLNKLFEA